jgi:hypothetical protein
MIARIQIETQISEHFTECSFSFYIRKKPEDKKKKEKEFNSIGYSKW